MSSPPVESNRRVINHPEQLPEAAWDTWGTDVVKIVLGPSPGQSDAKPLSLGELPPNLARRCPQLTHLYLWQIAGLSEVPVLPVNLECLDLRGCADFTTLLNLPANLESLILDGCVALQQLPELKPGALPRLRELSLKGCGQLTEKWIHDALKAAPNLEFFAASNCPQLTRILAWPPTLQRIELNGCAKLKTKPGRWPARLRRLGLRGAAAIGELPDFPATLDCVDLAFTESLKRLPEKWGKPRTLFLFGSGVLMPPASEHGKKADENVADRTRSYFEDVSLVGTGEVKRCKLLLLGNGGAGKTCLALRLVLDKDPVTDHPGTTHGVQFWDWPVEADLAGTAEPVHLHLWDFGGQEIYHNTHRLFMGKGAVFLLLWYPQQDGDQPPLDPITEYRDEWRPLQYWLDLIHLACPHRPRIALVCSHHAVKTDALERQWRDQVTAKHHDLRCFYIDSKTGRGEVAELKLWLSEEIGQVVHTQGVAVPAHWEIAQDLVESWLPKPLTAGGAPGPARYNRLTPDEFQRHLGAAITAAIETGKTTAELAAAWRDETFILTPDRLRRTLEFLTHSGWVYWDEHLFQQQVIIGQQWALDGIYAALERRPKMRVYQNLRAARGQFTRPDLAGWVWSDLHYSEADQRLLLSFMKSVGVCFELVSEAESRWREPVYKSFQHLPSAEELKLAERFGTDRGAAAQTIECPRLHKGHWHAVLQKLGEHYSTDAFYAADGFLVRNREEQTLYLTVHLNPQFLGGRIEVRVAGPDAEARVAELTAWVQGLLPEPRDGTAPSPAEPRSGNVVGTRRGQIQLFISYKRYNENPPLPGEGQQPVIAISDALNTEPVKVLRDDATVQSGENIFNFMQRIRNADRVLVVHREEYWWSRYCMYEFTLLLQSFVQRKADLADVLILISHGRDIFRDPTLWSECRSFWRDWNGELPPMLVGKVTKDWLKQEAEYFLDRHFADVAAVKDRSLAWPTQARSASERRREESKVIAWVKQLLGLPSHSPES